MRGLVSRSLTASFDVIQTGESQPMTTKLDSRFSARVAQRALWCCLAIAGGVTLVIAATLEPDARGYGTHTQLGFPSCAFLSFTGLPCPGCGLTTAFAHAVRGDWLLAGVANPLGLALFVVVCACIPLSVVAAVRDWSLDAVFERFAVGRWALAVAGCGVVLWVARLATAL